MISLILGGQRSGKSAFALTRLASAPAPQDFIATGKAMDEAFRAQIAAHRVERDPHLPVIEAGADLAVVLELAASSYRTLLVDSLDFWLFAAGGGNAAEYVARLDALLGRWHDDPLAPELILVSAEAGLGPVAADASTRAYLRALGGLNQTMARHASHAWLVAAGLPLRLK